MPSLPPIAGVARRVTTASAPPPKSLSQLQRAVLGFVVAPLLLASGLGMYVLFEQLSQIQSNRLKDDLELIGSAISKPVGEHLQRGDAAAVQRLLESVFSIGQVYGASVFDVNGERIASTGIAERDLRHSVIPEVVVATGETQERYRRVGERRVFSHFVPVTDLGGRINGLIQINRRASDFDRSFQGLVRTAWTVWGGLAVLTVVIVLLGHYVGIGRHVQRLLGDMARVEAGERGYRTAVAGPGEIAAISRGLNRMLDAVNAAEQALVANREEQLALARRLRESEKMAAVGRMAGGIAHEMGAPLSVIDGRATQIARRLPEATVQREVGAIRQQVQRLTRTVAQLLDYSRPAAQRLAPVQLTVALRSALRAAQQEWAATGAAAPTVRLAAAPALPAVAGDATRLELAFVNILRNAAQAGAATIDIAAAVEAQQLRITFANDGAELPDLPRAQLLEPFVTTKGPGHGTGLGLAIVASVMAEHEGTVSLLPRAGGGCIVQLELSVSAFEHPCDGGAE